MLRKLSVTKKTGFKITDPSMPVIIRDNRHILFYSTESQVPNVWYFNLPAFGTYFVESGSFTPMEKPVEYEHVEIPEIQRRFLVSPYNFKIVWGINPNKCSIMWNRKTILFDSQFKDKPLTQVFFILYHEFAHLYSKDESICDHISSNYMKEKGFNPSQISSALSALSDRQIVRKTELVNNLAKVS